MILKVFSNLVDTKGVIDHILTIFILFLVTPLFLLHHFSQEHTYCFVLHVTLLLYQLKKVIPSDILHSKSYGCTYHKTSICFFTLLRNKHELKGHVKRSRLIFLIFCSNSSISIVCFPENVWITEAKVVLAVLGLSKECGYSGGSRGYLDLWKSLIQSHPFDSTPLFF